jgi:hypothetical protein
MADQSQHIKYVFADSRNRDTSLYPSGNTFTLYLTNPVHSVNQVDLVAARVPNTMFNLTDGSNVLTFRNTSTTTNISLLPGYYSARQLAYAMTGAAGFLFSSAFLESQGKFLFYSNVAPFSLQANTDEIQRMLGFPDSNMIQSFYYSSDPVFAPDPKFVNQNLLIGPKIADLMAYEYVFLDIEELRSTSILDARKLIQGTTDGQTIRSTFGMVPMDVSSGYVKFYKETSDYNQYVQYNTPIPKIDRLTIRWIDRTGKSINFQTFDHNAFTLRIYCEYKEPPPPTPPLQDVQIQRIVDALTHAPPPPKPPEEKRVLGRWVLIIVIIGFVAAYVAYVRLLRPLVERMAAIPPPPQFKPKISLY